MEMLTLHKLGSEINLTEQAHRSIKRFILAGNIDTELRLTEEFFARELGISKAPVREALNALQTEGLVRIEPRRGTYLHRFSKKEIADLYDLREALEVFATQTAMLPVETLDALDASVARTCEYVATDRKAEHIDEDAHFHALIVGATGNEELQRVHGNIQSKLWLCRCQTYRLTSPDTPVSHRQIAEALRAGDRTRAAEITRNHIRTVRGALLNEVSAGPSHAPAGAHELHELH